MITAHRHRVGVVRREFLQVGFSGFLGMGVSSLLKAKAGAGAVRAVPGVGGPKPRARSMILVFLTGAPSHIDTFDMKPDAPDEIRGDFKPIATNVAGLQICEHLPK